MKKRLSVILSLIMAFVLCFALVACGGDNDKGKQKEDSGKPVSISVNDAIDAIDSVLNAKGLTGTVSYTQSTKNTEAVTQTLSYDKRGTKIKVVNGEEETIVDLATGYVYTKGENGYTFDNKFYANEFGYVQYVLSGIKQSAAENKIEARYDEKAKTVTFVEERADSINKYVEPLQDAYADGWYVGDLLDEYCYMFSGKSFDEIYNILEGYVKNNKNTVGTLLDKLNSIGVDVEAILEMTGMGLPEDQMTAIKARTLGQVVVSAYKYIKDNWEVLLPTAVDDGVDDDSAQGGIIGGMQSFGMGLLQAMLFEQVSEADVTKGLQEIKFYVGIIKGFEVQATIDLALKDNEAFADLYTIIKDGVKVKNATVTVTLKVDDDKNITGVKVDCLASHTYNGEAKEGSFLADNNYLTSAEIKIDEYKTSVEDFVIQCDPACKYKMPVTALLYDFTDEDVSVYFETAGNTVNVSSYVLEWIAPSGEIREIQPEDENVFRFDAATSSFVFDGELRRLSDQLLGSYLNAGYSAFGTSIRAIVFFDDEEHGYAITLTYVTDDLQEIYDYAYNMAMDKILEFIGSKSHDAPKDDSNNVQQGQAA